MKRKFWGDKHAPGPEVPSTTVHVDDLMAQRVVALSRHQTVGHARTLMQKLGIHSLPVVDSEGAPLGILTATDLLATVKDDTLVGKVMTRDVKTVTRYVTPSVAAHLMRKHHIHHLVVIHEGKVTGVLSSFDLLALIEEKRFVMKNRPSKLKKATWEARRHRRSPG